jgi:hypothetical protein
VACSARGIAWCSFRSNVLYTAKSSSVDAWAWFSGRQVLSHSVQMPIQSMWLNSAGSWAAKPHLALVSRLADQSHADDPSLEQGQVHLWDCGFHALKETTSCRTPCTLPRVKWQLACPMR